MADNNYGFTLIEILVVVILLSLVTISGISWFKSIDKIKVRRTAERFGYFLKYLYIKSIEESEDIEVIISHPECKIIAVTENKTIEFKKPSKVKCRIENSSENEQDSIILISSGFIAPAKVTFFSRSGKVSSTIDTTKINLFSNTR